MILIVNSTIFLKTLRLRLHYFVPFIYTQTENLPLKTIISKNSGQRRDFENFGCTFACKLKKSIF